MATKRTYGDGCAIARALDLVGERWALLVVRELLLGPKRYTDLRKGLATASPNVLSERLRELEAAGVVRRGKLPPPAGSRVYELTAWGEELEEVVTSLGRWAARSPTPPDDVPIASPDSVILALQARFDPSAASRLEASYELRLGEDRFRVEVAGDRLEVARGSADRPDATLETDNDTIAALLWGGLSLRAAERSGKLKVEGDRTAAARFVQLFPMPEPAAAEPAAASRPAPR